MACNCWKNRRRPLGTGRVKADDQGGKEGQRGYSLTTMQGKRITFGSKLEAQAARVRQGGGTIRPI